LIVDTSFYAQCFAAPNKGDMKRLVYDGELGIIIELSCKKKRADVFRLYDSDTDPSSYITNAWKVASETNKYRYDGTLHQFLGKLSLQEYHMHVWNMIWQPGYIKCEDTTQILKSAKAIEDASIDDVIRFAQQ
jgi:hypothetical protein